MLRTSPKPFIFVLMPFSDEFSDIYELGIKDACRDAGAYCERVDEQIFDGINLQEEYLRITGESKCSCPFSTEDFVLKFHNSTETRIETTEFYMGMILPKGCYVRRAALDPNWRIMQLPTTEETLFLNKKPFRLLPGAWDFCTIGFGIDDYSSDFIRRIHFTFSM